MNDLSKRNCKGIMFVVISLARGGGGGEGLNDD